MKRSIKFLLTNIFLLLIVFGFFAFSNSEIFQGKIFNLKKDEYKLDNNKSITIPKKIKPKNYDFKCRVVDTYEEILDCYDSMNDVENTLYDMTIQHILGGTSTGRAVVFQLLNNGYDGNSDNQTKEDFLADQLISYAFLPGQREYVIRVAHSLWVEKNAIVQWSLKDFSNNEIALLFWVIQLYPDELPPVDLEDDYRQVDPENTVMLLGEESSWKLFNLSSKFLANSIDTTIENIIRWEKKNFFHAYYEYGWEVYDEDGGRPDNLDRLFEERVVGCHLTSLILQNMLRSLNIPVVQLAWGHSYVYLPTLDKYVHGDHIADFVLPLPNDFLLTEDEIIAIFTADSDHYDAHIRGLYTMADSMHAITSAQLLRSGNALHIWTDSVNWMDYDRVFAIIDQEVPEFNVQFDDEENLIYSDFIPIETLEELSEVN